MLIADLRDLHVSPHYDLGVRYATDSSEVVCRYSTKIYCLVTGLARSTCEAMGTGKKVVNSAYSAFDDAKGAFTFHSYSPDSRETDFKLDRQSAIVLVSAQHTNIFQVEKLHVVSSRDLPAVKANVKQLMHLCINCAQVAAPSDSGTKRRQLEALGTEIKCRRLDEAWPSDPPN